VESDLAFFARHDKENGFFELRLSERKSFESPARQDIDVLAIEALDRQNYNIVGSFGPEAAQALFKIVGARLREHSGQVVDSRSEWRKVQCQGTGPQYDVDEERDEQKYHWRSMDRFAR
jgi:hypothetical protein